MPILGVEKETRVMSGKENPTKILVIVDEPIAISVLKDRVKGKNHHVIVANTGEEGIKLSHRELPNLILMDMISPRMHGSKHNKFPYFCDHGDGFVRS